MLKFWMNFVGLLLKGQKQIGSLWLLVIWVWILGKGSWGPIAWRIRRDNFDVDAEILWVC